MFDVDLTINSVKTAVCGTNLHSQSLAFSVLLWIRKYPRLRAAGYHQLTSRQRWKPASRSLRLVVPGKILINSFIYEEPK